MDTQSQYILKMLQMCLIERHELRQTSRLVGGSNDGPRGFTGDQQVASANFPVL